MIKIGTPVFKQVEHKLKAFRTFIIGVRHIVVTGCKSDKFHHRHNLGFCLDCRRKFMKVAFVGCIHRDNEVKVVKIRLPEFARAVREVISATLRMDTHTPVG